MWKIIWVTDRSVIKRKLIKNWFFSFVAFLVRLEMLINAMRIWFSPLLLSFCARTAAKSGFEWQTDSGRREGKAGSIHLHSQRARAVSVTLLSSVAAGAVLMMLNILVTRILSLSLIIMLEHQEWQHIRSKEDQKHSFQEEIHEVNNDVALGNCLMYFNDSKGNRIKNGIEKLRISSVKIKIPPKTFFFNCRLWISPFNSSSVKRISRQREMFLCKYEYFYSRSLSFFPYPLGLPVISPFLCFRLRKTLARPPRKKKFRSIVFRQESSLFSRKLLN